MNGYRITQAAANNLKRIEGIVDELKRQNAVSTKLIEDEQQSIQSRLEAIAIITEYAGAVKADGMR